MISNQMVFVKITDVLINLNKKCKITWYINQFRAKFNPWCGS